MSTARALCAGYALLVLYLCLYPWGFSPQPVQALWSWQLPAGRTLYVDAILNVLLFLPLGLLAALSLPRRYLFTIPLLAVTFSATVEWLQVYLPSRDSSAWDLLYNTTGACVGLLLASPASHRFSTRSARVSLSLRDGQPLLLLALFVAAQLFPFIPRIRIPQLRQSLQMLPAIPDSLVLVTAFVSFLAAGYWIGSLDALRSRRSARLLLLLGFLAVRPFFPGGVHAGLAIVAAALGGISAEVVPRRLLCRWLGPAFLVYLVFRQLHPFSFLPTAQDVYWIPFDSILQLQTEQGVNILFEKCFTYGTAIALLAFPRNSHFRAAAACFFVLSIGEFAQQWIAGRTPDTLDPGIAIIMGSLLALLAGAVSRAAGRSSRDAGSNPVPSPPSSIPPHSGSSS